MCDMSMPSYHGLNLPSHSLKIKFSLAFSEINQEYQYPFFIFVRLADMLNCDFLFCSITYIPLTVTCAACTKSFKHYNNK